MWVIEQILNEYCMYGPENHMAVYGPVGSLQNIIIFFWVIDRFINCHLSKYCKLFVVLYLKDQHRITSIS